MKLCADIGNSAIKLGIYNGQVMVDYVKLKDAQFDQIEAFIKIYPIDQVTVSSVRQNNQAFMDAIGNIDNVLFVNHETKLPIDLNYNTPETLGIDRITAALGALAAFPNENCIIIDLGTCITLDLLTEKRSFEGGNISPGMNMRLAAMHQMTSKLPKVSTKTPSQLLGKDTTMALQNGAFYGILFEISGFIDEIKKKYNNVKVILTGGYANDFVELLGSEIFVHPFLILDGLNYLNESNT